MRIIESFHNMTALVDRATNRTQSAANKAFHQGKEGESRDVSYNNKRSGTPTFEAATALATAGWPEGRAKMAALMDRAKAATQTRPERTATYDVAGAYPMPAFAAAGEPACMVDFRDDQARRQTPVVGILYNIGASGGIPPETIMARGAAILAEVDALEAAGLRCEITLCAYVTDQHEKGKPHSQSHRTDCRVKEADQPMDIDRLAFALAHPSMLRRLVFALREAHEFGKAIGDGYGYSTDAPPAERNGCDVYVPAMFTLNKDATEGWTDPATAATKARAMFDGIWTAYTEAA